MKLIPLTKNKFAMVDDADYDWLIQWSWCTKEDDHRLYARRGIYIDGKHYIIEMHRQILGLQKRDGVKVDHIDHNGLNNQRSNLRICTDRQNMANRIKLTGRSIYLGVGFSTKWGKERIRARICVDYKNIFLGYFNTEIEAACAYDEAAKKYHGEFANLNFK